MRKLLITVMVGACLMLAGCYSSFHASINPETKTLDVDYKSFSWAWGDKQIKDVQFNKTGDTWRASLGAAESFSKLDQEALIKGIIEGVKLGL